MHHFIRQHDRGEHRVCICLKAQIEFECQHTIFIIICPRTELVRVCRTDLDYASVVSEMSSWEDSFVLDTA